MNENHCISAKYYALSGQFNRGLYARGSIGFGQLTTKRANEVTNNDIHQFAVGSTLTGSIGYSFPFNKSAISIEAEFESSSRSGTINGIGDQSISSGQAGFNVIYSF